MLPFSPLPSKPTKTRLKAEEDEEEGTIEAEEEGPSWIQISYPLVPSPVLPSPQSLTLPEKAFFRKLAGKMSRYLSNWKRITNNNIMLNIYHKFRL